jgi:hypothetical protein
MVRVYSLCISNEIDDINVDTSFKNLNNVESSTHLDWCTNFKSWQSVKSLLYVLSNFSWIIN